MVIPIIDAFTSWFAGMVIFATLGYMAETANVEIKDVISHGRYFNAIIMVQFVFLN